MITTANFWEMIRNDSLFSQESQAAVAKCHMEWDWDTFKMYPIDPDEITTLVKHTIQLISQKEDKTEPKI